MGLLDLRKLSERIEEVNERGKREYSSNLSILELAWKSLRALHLRPSFPKLVRTAACLWVVGSQLTIHHGQTGFGKRNMVKTLNTSKRLKVQSSTPREEGVQDGRNEMIVRTAIQLRRLWLPRLHFLLRSSMSHYPHLEQVERIRLAVHVVELLLFLVEVGL